MKKYLFSWLVIAGGVMELKAQGTTGSVIGQDSTNHVITTAVPFLTITPDSRAAGMGDAGVATSADANSSYWNPGKLVFIDKGFGFSTSYTPWLAKIINDMKLLYLTGFYKIDRNQVVSASLKYFDMGDIQFRTATNVENGRYNPREYAFDVTYSRLLTEHFGLGGSLRYIRSNLTGANPNVSDARPGSSIAVDIGAFYKKDFKSHNASLSLGGSITNIGSKMTYTSPAEKNFIPTNLRLGGAYKTELDAKNSLTFVMDFNKLMVPSPGSGNTAKPLLSGIFGSFSDAKGGLSEELREITVSTGIEYWYNDFFAARLGYFYEAKDKGNRKYLTTGLGFRYESPVSRDQFGLDVAYMVPTTIGQNALAETLRFTLFYVLPVKEVKQNESVNPD
ncbi:MAG: type IX secretion system outer membrane channel protein PorV [Bacteroidetes bacterium]|nr:type IX secretion system outer membrane channel protein PorV [Bacteroidota bacterium]